MLADVQMNVGSSSAHVQWFSCWKIRADGHDIISRQVTGPGRAVLFYGRHSMGEGLTTDEARDAKFLLTGACTWVQKLAYLTTDSITIQEGKRAIAQAISDH